MKILLVEDEPDLASNVTDFLKGEMFVCEWAKDKESAVDKIISYDYDIVILDIMLPDGSGLDVLKALKESGSEAGVLIVSAKNSLDDKLLGFEGGADDYLTKPFHLSELNARLLALYRRKGFQGATRVAFNEIEIDTVSDEVFVNGASIVLTRKEFELLRYLFANRNRVLSKHSIAEHLWGDHVDLSDSFDFVYQHIKNLRKKLMKAGAGNYIRTIYGMGYKFGAEEA
ncbi:DNA-binding response regulator [Fulvitalea axinellae]|uniref:DNA-binding response regulator n=1 Tax=Fulvitalea axinellae TaxID=1182444 RepID=A0AAU9CWB4_9BACT|nr:DNA-binding response regulator [Fulvitalea axinellae]